MTSIDINKLKSAVNKENFIFNNFENKNLDIELIYDSNFENSKILRNLMDIIWKKLNLLEKDLSRLILVIDELNNNAIEYWTDKLWKNKFRIKIVNNWDSILFNIEVEDNWKWDSAKTTLEMETLRAHQLKLWYGLHSSIRWRWLFMIIVKSVDRLYFKDSDEWWLIVWVYKNIKI